MNPFRPNTTQGHFLLRLLILGEEPQKSKAKPSTFKKKDRDLLTAEGLIAEEKRGRAGHLVPTDRAWAWGSRHFAELVGPTSRLSADVAQALVKKIGAFLESNETSLAEFVAPSLFEAMADKTETEKEVKGEAPVEAAPVEAAPVQVAPVAAASIEASAPAVPEDLESRILDACRELRDETLGGRIRLSTLRSRFGELPRTAVDDSLLSMQRRGVLVLNSAEGFELAPEDAEAAVDVSGEKRHLAYLR